MASGKKAQDSIVSPITSVTVCGYKSLTSAQTLEIRPLTLLAGANSSGKSSIVQPLLLMKQTLSEASDPGAILLEGPNVKCTSVSDLLPKNPSQDCKNGFWVKLVRDSHNAITTYYVRSNGGFRIQAMSYKEQEDREVTLREGMSHEDILSHIPKHLLSFTNEIKNAKWQVLRRRCFLWLQVALGRKTLPFYVTPADFAAFHLERLIHLPGLRGNPEPTYPVRAVGREYPGQFHDYVASVIDKWQTSRSSLLKRLRADLLRLRLTWKVEATHVSDTRVELRVGRLPHGVVGGARDLVSIAHVGFGVSQALPVIVALHAALPGQLVYVEQPEIHLHPKAQAGMADLLVDAANRGVRVIAETHSSLMLLAIQAAVARGDIEPNKVKLHWFQRDEKGSTQVTSADLDEQGRFGGWPEDFAETEMQAQDAYLDAAEKKRAKGNPDA
jgi:hypothetical protein